MAFTLVMQHDALPSELQEPFSLVETSSVNSIYQMDKNTTKAQ